MKGITIIEEHLCRAVELSELIVVGVFMSLLVAGLLLIYRSIYKNGSKGNKIAIWVCSILAVVAYVVIWQIQISKYKTTHFEYTIAVDDSVCFNDFFDEYNIISVDGDRYRVMLKEA